jgi:hypothetical protein
MRRILLSILLLPFFSAIPSLAQEPLVKLTGDVVRADGQSLELKSTTGEKLAVRLPDQARLTLRAPTDASAIKPGAFIATTATPQPDGTLLASEVRVFGESLRGVGEGHRPMANLPGSTMTNATVASVSGGGKRESTTTATVAAVTGGGSGAQPLRMTVQYKGGEKTVVIPDSVQIMTQESGDRSMLVPGTHIVAYVARQPDGTLVSERVSIGKNGYAPQQ